MTQTLADYSTGYHSAWERELHIVTAARNAQGAPLNWTERGQVVDRFCQANPRTFEKVVFCEVCSEKIAEAIIEGRDPFQAPKEAKEYLEKYGIFVRSQKHLSKQTLHQLRQEALEKRQSSSIS